MTQYVVNYNINKTDSSNCFDLLNNDRLTIDASFTVGSKYAVGVFNDQGFT